MPDVKIGNQGVLRTVSKYSAEKAIAEYIWNGFDAGATEVRIDFDANEIGHINTIQICDNGSGINYDKLGEKFGPFMESEKFSGQKNRTLSDVHGKNGIGRLSFVSFALSARWQTVYEGIESNYEYSIAAKREKAYHYSPTKPQETDKPTGTDVILEGIFDLTSYEFGDKVKNYLIKDFCWYLELNKASHSIYINNEKIDYSAFLIDSDKIALRHKATNTHFEINFFQWREGLNEYSKYYFINSNNNELHKENTSFNNKGDGFYHSVLIKSSYFDNFDFSQDDKAKQQQLLAVPSKRDDQYRFLKSSLTDYLRKKRYPFLNINAGKLIEDLEESGAIPEYNDSDTISTLIHSTLVDTLKGLYKLEPKLFTNLNSEQKITFTRFIHLALQNGGRSDLFKILESVLDLSDEERKEYATLLENVSLSHIARTCKMLDERRSTIENLTTLVFDMDLFARETPHIQEVIQSNCWIFGEEYNVVAAEDKGFDAALRNYRAQIGLADTHGIEHPSKRKQVDVFATRKRLLAANEDDSMFENIIIELKSPDKKLGKDELDQVEEYMRLIKNTDQFNSKKSKWTFILVGNDFLTRRSESSPYIKDKIDTNERQGYGKDVAIHDVNNDYTIKVKTWSTVFEEFNIRYNFIYEQLQKEQQNTNDRLSAEEIVDKIKSRDISTELPEKIKGKVKKPRVKVVQ